MEMSRARPVKRFGCFELNFNAADGGVSRFSTATLKVEVIVMICALDWRLEFTCSSGSVPLYCFRGFSGNKLL